MSHLDRYGDTLEDTAAIHHCRNGWLTPADADVAIPCPVCKPGLRTRHRSTQGPRSGDSR